jgi:hypothetical protein
VGRMNDKQILEILKLIPVCEREPVIAQKRWIDEFLI